ncbi:hypothetical protein VTN96DRAFT_957 [Rasamsonia emersonii]
MSQGSSSEKIDLPDNVKALFVDDVESTPWGPFIKATMVNGRSMEDPEVQELHQKASQWGTLPLRPLPSGKWPATHAERIEYLKSIRKHPRVQQNVENIDAAIKLHETFPQTELYSSKLVYFQGGKRVDEWDSNQPSFWAEGLATAFMNNPPGQAAGPPTYSIPR